MSLVMDTFESVLDGVPAPARPKRLEEVPYSYAYRLSLCTMVGALTRMADGHPADISDAKLVVDDAELL